MPLAWSGYAFAVVKEGGMSGTVVIVIAALIGWFVLSVVLALMVGRRLGRTAPPVAPTWVRPVSIMERRRRDRRPAA